MRLLFDNDILFQLHLLNILEQAVSCVAGATTEVICLRLEDAPYVMKSKKFKKANNYDKIDEIILKVESMNYFSVPSTQMAMLEKLNHVANIDPGEIKLFAAVISSQDDSMLTGDKNCLRALFECQDDIALEVRQKLKGRVLTFEAVCEALILKHGASWLQQHTRTSGSRHSSLRMWCGFNFDASQESMLEGIRSSINELTRQTSPDFLWRHERANTAYP